MADFDLTCGNPECPSCKERALSGESAGSRDPEVPCHGCYWPRKCFWIEGGRCFCPKLGALPKMDCKKSFGSILGHRIDAAHVQACTALRTTVPGLRQGAMAERQPEPPPTPPVRGYDQGPFD